MLVSTECAVVTVVSVVKGVVDPNTKIWIWGLARRAAKCQQNNAQIRVSQNIPCLIAALDFQSRNLPEDKRELQPHVVCYGFGKSVATPFQVRNAKRVLRELFDCHMRPNT